MSEQDIGHKSDTQIHWEAKSPINDRLRSIVEPLTHHFTQEMQYELARSTPDKRHEMVEQAGNVYELPYGRIGMLPPAIFGDIDEDTIDLTTKLIVPESDKEISELVDHYLEWAWRLAGNKKYQGYAFSNREQLIKTMTAYKGMEYPYEDWLASAKVMQRALKDEPSFLMDMHRNNRMLNAAFDYDQLNAETAVTHRAYDSYVLVMSSKSTDDNTIQGTRDYVQLPVGDYGVEAAGKLARVTVALNDFVKTSPMIDHGVRMRMDPEDEILLAQHTARSRERYEDSMKDFSIHGVKNTLAEGILSVAQTISFLTAEKVEGYDDYDALVVAILDSDVIEQFTRIVRPGYIGPVTLSGLYMPGALVEKNGRLTLDKETVKILNEMRKTHVTEIMAKWALYESGEGKPPGVLGLTCPAAAPKGAITEIKGVLKAFYKKSPSNL